MVSTFVERDYDDTENKQQAPSRTVVKSSPYMRREIEHKLCNLGFVTKADVMAIVQSRLSKWTSTVQSQIVKALESTFRDALQPNYFNLSNILKTEMFSMVEQALGDVV